MKIFNFLKKEKRQKSYWFPFTSQVDSNPQRQSGNLSQIKRCLGLYKDVLMSCPLVAKKDGKELESHWLLDLLEKPCKWLNKSEFFTLLTENYFLSGNFYAHIIAGEDGRITALAPYPPGNIYCYAKTYKDDGGIGDALDPIKLNEVGFYYQSAFPDGKTKEGKAKQRISKIEPYHIWHLKNLWQHDGDPLNGNTLFQQFPEVLNFSQSILDLGDRFADSGGVGPVLISGVETEGGEQIEETQKVIEGFFKNKGMYLTLPANVKIDEIGKSATPPMIQALSSISSLHLARCLCVPVQLIEREDAMNTSGGGMNLKETYRFFLKTSAKSFVRNVQSKLNELSDEPGVKIEFNFRSLMASDLRESAMSLSQLIQSGAITKQEVREWLRI